MTEARELTQREIDANVAKLEAEAAKALADARKATAQAVNEEAEGRVYEINALNAEQVSAFQQSGDGHHGVYRFDGPVTAASVKAAIGVLSSWSRQKPDGEFEIIFSSPGGEIISGMALFDFLQELRSRGHKLTTGCAGMAASMAGILLQAGDVRWVGEQSWVMIHQAGFGVQGKTFDVEDELEFVKRIQERICAIFAKRSKLTARTIKGKWNRKDWWIDADEALKLGLVDEIRCQLP